MKGMMSRFLMFGLLVAVLFACKKDEFIKFSVAHESAFTIPNGTGVSVPVSINVPVIQTNSQSEFTMNGTDNDNIQHINLRSLELEITSPSGQEFDFLEDIELYISATGLNEVLLAYVYNMENIVDNTVSLTCSQDDLQEYIKQDKFTLRAKTTSDEFNLNDVEIQIKSAFEVYAKVLN